jgi:hypothetical protein
MLIPGFRQGSLHVRIPEDQFSFGAGNIGHKDQLNSGVVRIIAGIAYSIRLLVL